MNRTPSQSSKVHKSSQERRQVTAIQGKNEERRVLAGNDAASLQALGSQPGQAGPDMGARGGHSPYGSDPLRMGFSANSKVDFPKRKSLASTPRAVP